MHASIIPVLARLRQDVAEILAPQSIRDACRRAGYRWRDRTLDPAATLSLFLLQVLHGNAACRHVVHLGQRAFSATAYCRARKRLPLAVVQALVEMVAAKLRATSAEAAGWRGHRVRMIDGSGFSMPDVAELRDHFGSPAGQRPGCGFPVGHLVALFDLATGMLLRVATSPMRAHDMSQAAHLACELRPGDLLLGDRGFCSYAHLAILLKRGNHAAFRMHQRQIVDFTPGRPSSRQRGGAAPPKGSPHSTWVRSNGELDQVVIWHKGTNRPAWMTPDEFAGLPAEITVRELRYRVGVRGFRVRVVTLVTTLLDPSAYPKAELAELYRRRWQVELNLRHIKTTMKMDILHCKTVDGVLKEMAVFALAYNLVISVVAESARIRGVPADRISFLDTLRWLAHPIGDVDPGAILVNPLRPDRIEPRVIKRRMKEFPLMKEPRSELRNRLLKNEVAA